jgi:hypothetical protein
MRKGSSQITEEHGPEDANGLVIDTAWMNFVFFIGCRIESGPRSMVEKSIVDRIQDWLVTTGADLQEEVKRQYSHECGHIGMAGITGLITGDGIALADQLLRETRAMNGWSGMDVASQCEAVKRSFYLEWRKKLGLKGDPDTRPFGKGCCGFARAMGELIAGFPPEDPSISPGSRERVNSPGNLSGVDSTELADELRNIRARLDNDSGTREAALDNPCHLFFFSAIDRDGVTRFFDVLRQENGFTVAETATSAPRLGQCIDTVYGYPDGGTHHVHRNYGQFSTDTAPQAMEEFANAMALSQVTKVAETLSLQEALPIWKIIYEKLGLRF